MKGTLSSDIKFVRVVQWHQGFNSENEFFSEFVEEAYRPCVVNETLAIDIFTMQSYPLIKKDKNKISSKELLKLDTNIQYGDLVLTPQFTCPPEELADLRRRAEEIASWYTLNVEREKRNCKIIDFQKVRRRGTRRNI